MKHTPILMSAPMVRATLDGRKTQTRRIVKELKSASDGSKARLFVSDADIAEANEFLTNPGRHPNKRVKCPFGRPGDRLWVRETWAEAAPIEPGYVYRADIAGEDRTGLRWRPSTHMPRGASRITLNITGVRVERLNDISEADAIAEGIWEQPEGFNITPPHRPLDDGYDSARDCYADLWESIHGPDSWDLNPWVWVIEFRRVEQLTTTNRS